MPDRKNTGQMFALPKPDDENKIDPPRNPYEFAPDAKPGGVDVSDPGLLPGLHRLLAGEVKDLSKEIHGHIGPAVKRIDTRLEAVSAWNYERAVADGQRHAKVIERIDALEVKLDKLIAMVLELRR